MRWPLVKVNPEREFNSGRQPVKLPLVNRRFGQKLEILGIISAERGRPPDSRRDGGATQLVVHMRALGRILVARCGFFHDFHFEADRQVFRRIAGGIVAGLIAENSAHHVFPRHDGV